MIYVTFFISFPLCFWKSFRLYENSAFIVIFFCRENFTFSIYACDIYTVVLFFFGWLNFKRTHALQIFGEILKKQKSSKKNPKHIDGDWKYIFEASVNYIICIYLYMQFSGFPFHFMFVSQKQHFFFLYNFYFLSPGMRNKFLILWKMIGYSIQVSVIILFRSCKFFAINYSWLTFTRNKGAFKLLVFILYVTYRTSFDS